MIEYQEKDVDSAIKQEDSLMKKYEYMTADLGAEPSFNVHRKMERYIEKLNEYGRQGWRLISGTDDWKYSVFEREIEDTEK